jgi:S1-C subfamily serine protease
LDGLSGKAIKDALSRPAGRETLNTRGKREVDIYRKASPAVVLVLTTEGIGSGTHLGEGLILTNWHVIRSFKTVGVVFKPREEGAEIKPSDVVRAQVVQTDPTPDLAILRAAVVPPHAGTIEFGGPVEIKIGADVHAIGHPTGEVWTYTKGLISQVRSNYEWEAASGKHRANVIQTQTPVNPGNSGGPLISNSGKLLGVNSFKTSGENLNFAVSINDVVAFLAGPARKAFTPPTCKPVIVYDGRNQANDGRLIQSDINCDRIPDIAYLYPDDPKQPYTARIASNFDGKVDIIVEDTDRDGRWDVSVHDVDYDGKVDLVGYHPDGRIMPSRYGKYTE